MVEQITGGGKDDSLGSLLGVLIFSESVKAITAIERGEGGSNLNGWAG